MDGSCFSRFFLLLPRSQAHTNIKHFSHPFSYLFLQFLFYSACVFVCVKHLIVGFFLIHVLKLFFSSHNIRIQFGVFIHTMFGRVLFLLLPPFFYKQVLKTSKAAYLLFLVDLSSSFAFFFNSMHYILHGMANNIYYNSFSYDISTTNSFIFIYKLCVQEHFCSLQSGVGIVTVIYKTQVISKIVRKKRYGSRIF